MANPVRQMIESDRGTLRHLRRIATKVDSYASEMEAVSDSE